MAEGLAFCWARPSLNGLLEAVKLHNPEGNHAQTQGPEDPLESPGQYGRDQSRRYLCDAHRVQRGFILKYDGRDGQRGQHGGSQQLQCGLVLTNIEAAPAMKMHERQPNGEGADADGDKYQPECQVIHCFPFVPSD